MYDMIIIGGGISGLYLAYKLQNDYNILLLEKSNYLGGRIYTYNFNIVNTDYKYEAGAGRISSNHKLLLKLIENLDLSDELVEISTKKEHIHNYTRDYEQFYNIGSDEKLNIVFLLDIIFKKCKNYSKEYLSNILFMDFVMEILTIDSSQFLLDSYGYTAEFLKLNAYDAIRLFKNDVNLSNKFFILNGGLSLIIDNLKNRLTKVTIQTRTLVEDYTFNNGIFSIKTRNIFNTETIKSKILIFATNKYGLKNIPSLNNKIPELIESVVEIPMARIYAIFKKGNNNKVWFDNIGKITTNGPIQYIIPINKQTGLIMISYPDLDRALYWKDTNIHGDLKKEIMLEIRKMFPNKNIADPIYMKMHFWNNGVHCFKPGTPSYKISDKIIQPFKTEKLYITGEAYSRRQAWIEGALETSEIVIKKLKINYNKINSKKTNTYKLPLISIDELEKHNTLEDACSDRQSRTI